MFAPSRRLGWPERQYCFYELVACKGQSEHCSCGILFTNISKTRLQPQQSNHHWWFLMNSPNAQAAHSFTGLTIAVKRGEWWIREAQMLDLLTVSPKDGIFIFCSWWMSQATSFPGVDRIVFKNDQSTTVHQNFTGMWCYKVQFGVIVGLSPPPIVVVPSDVFSCVCCVNTCVCAHTCATRTLRMWRRLLWHLEASAPTFFFFFYSHGFSERT